MDGSASEALFTLDVNCDGVRDLLKEGTYIEDFTPFFLESDTRIRAYLLVRRLNVLYQCTSKELEEWILPQVSFKDSGDFKQNFTLSEHEAVLF